MAHGMDVRREADSLEKNNLGEIFDFELRAFDDASAPAEASTPSARADDPAVQPADAKEAAPAGTPAPRYKRTVS